MFNDDKPLDCTQSLSFLLVIEGLERVRCATARETGVSKVDGREPHSPRGCASRSLQSLITVDEKRKGLSAA